MNDRQSQSGQRRANPQDVWKLTLAAIAVVAVVKELRKPPGERTWFGKIGFIPYDFRKPTADRFRDTYWNPDGPVLSSKLWGAGWALNFGALKRLVSR